MGASWNPLKRTKLWLAVSVCRMEHKVRYSTSHPGVRPARSPQELGSLHRICTDAHVDKGGSRSWSWLLLQQALSLSSWGTLGSHLWDIVLQGKNSASQPACGCNVPAGKVPTFLKDILFSVRNVKCLLISKTIKGDCRTVPFCLGNSGSSMLFSADLKHYSQLSESCVTCPFTSFTVPFAPDFPLRGCPICPCPFLHKIPFFYIACKSKN